MSTLTGIGAIRASIGSCMLGSVVAGGIRASGLVQNAPATKGIVTTVTST